MKNEKYYSISWGGLLSIIGVIFLIGIGSFIYFDIKNDIKEQKINFDIGNTRATIIDEKGIEIRTEGIILRPSEQRVLEIRVPTPDKIGVYQLCLEHRLEDLTPILVETTSPINKVSEQIHKEGNKFSCRRITFLPYHLEKGYYETYWKFVQKLEILEEEQAIYLYFEQEPTIVVYTQDKMTTSNTSGGASYYLPN